MSTKQQGGPVIALGTRFFFHCLLQLTRPHYLHLQTGYCNFHCSKIDYLPYSQDSSLGIMTDYRLDYQSSTLVGARDFSLLHSIENSSGTHQASYPMGTEYYFPKGKAAKA
jgi:hypothetical protein